MSCFTTETQVVRKNRSAGVSPASEPRQLLLGQHDLCRLEAGDTFFLTTTETRFSPRLRASVAKDQNRNFTESCMVRIWKAPVARPKFGASIELDTLLMLIRFKRLKASARTWSRPFSALPTGMGKLLDRAVSTRAYPGPRK